MCLYKLRINSCCVNYILHSLHLIPTSSPPPPPPPQRSLLFDIIPPSVQPSSLRPSFLPSPLYFHFQRSPFYVVFLSSHHIPIPHQPPFLDFLCDFPHFRCPPYSFIFYLRTSTHPSQHSHFCDLQFLFLHLLQCPCFCPLHQCCVNYVVRTISS